MDRSKNVRNTKITGNKHESFCCRVYLYESLWIRPVTNWLESGTAISRVLIDIMAEEQSISRMNGYDNEEDQMVGCISA